MHIQGRRSRGGFLGAVAKTRGVCWRGQGSITADQTRSWVGTIPIQQRLMAVRSVVRQALLMLMTSTIRRERDSGTIICMAHRPTAHPGISIPIRSHMIRTGRGLRVERPPSIRLVRIRVIAHLAIPCEVRVIMERRGLRVDMAHPRPARRGTRDRSHRQPRARSTWHRREAIVPMDVTAASARVEVIIVVVQGRTIKPGRSKCGRDRSVML